MTRINWGSTGERFFETGIDRGVLYLPGQDGVPWNGLKSVSESPDGGEPQPYYVDGYKYINVASAEEYKATLSAFSAPREFGVCDGTVGIHNGLFATQQPRRSFGLSYRTVIGDDISGIDGGYKIHIVYNALAAPSSRENASISDSLSPIALSWGISTTPPKITGLRPTAHFVIDSRYTNSVTLAFIENILYGYISGQSRLPDVDELIALFSWEPPVVGAPLNFLGYISSDIRTIVNNNRPADVPPFDGSSQNLVAKHQRVYAAWQGTPGSSPSAFDYYVELDKVGNPGDAYIINGGLWVFLPEGYWQNYGGLPSI